MIERDADRTTTGVFLDNAQDLIGCLTPTYKLPRARLGKPTGVFLDNAQDLVVRLTLAHRQLRAQFAAAVRNVHAVGITAVHDAGFNPVLLEFFERCVLRFHVAWDGRADRRVESE